MARQDREKSFGQRFRERVVGTAARILRNRPRGEVATKIELSGRVDNLQTNTWQVVRRLLQNAFFKAILPGFDRSVEPASRKSSSEPAAPARDEKKGTLGELKDETPAAPRGGT